VEWLEDRTLLNGPLAFSAMNYPFSSDPPKTMFADTPTSIVVGSKGGLLYRYDEVANTWSQLPISINIGAPIQTINFTPTSGEWVIGTGDGTVGHVYQYDSINGTTVQASPTGNFGIDTSVYIPGTETLIFRSYQGDVYSTTDGLNFSLLAKPPAEAIFTSLRTSTGVLYMGGEDETETPLKSTDNGVTWTPTNNGTLKYDLVGLAEATNGDILVAKSNNAGATLVRISPNSGDINASASGLPAFATIGQIVSLGNGLELCLVNKNAPYESTDDGFTWTATSLPFGENAHFGKTASYVYYSVGGTMYRSPISAATGSFSIAGFPSPSTAGVAGSFTVTALDSSGNVDSGYTGTVHFSSSDSQAVLPADYTFSGADQGVHTFSVTLKSAGSQSITATDTVTSSITGSQSGITVDPAAASQLVIHTQPSSTATAGQAFATQPVIWEEDAFGNVETGDNSTQVTAALHSGSGPLQGTTTVTVSGGVATFTNLADNMAETISLDFTSGTLTKATSNSIVIGPAGTSDDDLFVSGTFHDLLGRAVDMPSLNAFLAPIDNARLELLPSFADRFLFSNEYFTNRVNAYYPKYLGRAADSSGLAGSVAVLTDGATDEQVIAGLVGSAEYFANNGGTTASFVSAAFRDILGRTLSDPTGEAFFAAQIQAGASRTTVALELLTSAEYRTDLVASYYSTFLGRSGSTNEIKLWANSLTSGLRDENVISNFVSSQEYFQNASLGGNFNVNWLTSLYQHPKILNRAPDQAGLDFNLNGLLNGYAVQRQAENTALITSTEYRNSLVTAWYTKYLQRTADAGGLAGALASLAAGATDEQVIADLVGSTEYFQLHGSDNTSFLYAVFNDILGRAIDVGAKTFFLGQLSFGVSRTNLALELLSSTEYRANVVGGFYTKLLGRSASGSETDGWVAAMAAGNTDEQVITSFLTTNEYFLRAHNFP
jgi:hypothetical protein